MKDKEYFFYPDWRERKKKFLRICNEIEFQIRQVNEAQEERIKRITIKEL